MSSRKFQRTWGSHSLGGQPDKKQILLYGKNDVLATHQRNETFQGIATDFESKKEGGTEDFSLQRFELSSLAKNIPSKIDDIVKETTFSCKYNDLKFCVFPYYLADTARPVSGVLTFEQVLHGEHYEVPANKKLLVPGASYGRKGYVLKISCALHREIPRKKN